MLQLVMAKDMGYYLKHPLANTPSSVNPTHVLMGNYLIYFSYVDNSTVEKGIGLEG